jgi:hypothetical protein
MVTARTFARVPGAPQKAEADAFRAAPAAAMAVPSRGSRSVRRRVRRHRGLGQQIIAVRGQGTLMRHVICAPSVTPRPRRMREATAAARLVTPAGFAQGAAARRACATGRAVNLAAVATAADHHLGTAAPAQKKPGRRRRAPELAWTRFPGAAIIPPHSCPRTVQGTAPRPTVRLRSAPCLSPDRIWSYRTRGRRSARRRRRGARRPGLPRWANRRPPTRAAPSRVGALRGARGSPLFATWTTLFPSQAELYQPD